jgi:hypothetical protein
VADDVVIPTTHRRLLCIASVRSAVRHGAPWKRGIVAVERDDPQLTPREQRIIARMEEEFGDHETGMAGRAVERPASLLFIGVAVAVQGAVLAFGIPTGPAPLAISGYILILLGSAIVWYQLLRMTG